MHSQVRRSPTARGVATLDGVPTSAATGTSAGSVVASFAGDLASKPSNGTGDLVVDQASTTTTLTSSANPSVFGQAVTFTATVAAVAPGGGTPTGTVNFLDGTTNIGTGTLNASGVATLSTSTLSVSGSPHSITAVYAGTTDYITSTSSPALSQVVNHASTTTALTSSANPSVFGQAVTFTATVAAVAPGAGVPTGTVNFLDGTSTTPIGTGTLNASGVATLSTSTLSVSGSPHSITAVYVGDTSFSTSTSTAVSQVVNQADHDDRL